MTKAIRTLNTTAAVQNPSDPPDEGSSSGSDGSGSGSLPSSVHTIQPYAVEHDWEYASEEELNRIPFWRFMKGPKLVQCRRCGTLTTEGIQEVRTPSCAEAIVRRVQDS
jgi:hypothetical protein